MRTAPAHPLPMEPATKLQAATIDTPWYNEPLVIGLSAFDLGLAAVVALATYVAMLTALRVARATSLRLSSHGGLHGAGSAARVIAEILGGTSQGLMLLTALLIGVGTLNWRSPGATGSAISGSSR